MNFNSLIHKNKFEILVYLENNLNDGSPSGFSGQMEVLGEFSAGRKKPISIKCLQVKYPVLEYSVSIKELTPVIQSRMVAVHPLFFEQLKKEKDLKKYELCDELDAYVTASGRTVAVNTENDFYFLKLHFPGVIGRVNRHLPFRKAIAGVEISNIVANLILTGKLDEMGLLPEIKCCGVNTGFGIDEGSWSHIERSGNIVCKNGVDKDSLLIPSFSLFAERKTITEEKLIKEICEYLHVESVSQFFEMFLKPLILGYLKITFIYGLMPEINAQNLLYAFNYNNRTVYPVLRDMGRVEKLLYINDDLRDLLSCPYKSTEIKSSADYALKRHSFSFDFKLTRYVIEPLTNAFCDSFHLDAKTVKNEISKLSTEILDSISGVRKWLPVERTVIGHPNILLTKERPYIECGKPFII